MERKQSMIRREGLCPHLAAACMYSGHWKYRHTRPRPMPDHAGSFHAGDLP